MVSAFVLMLGLGGEPPKPALNGVYTLEECRTLENSLGETLDALAWEMENEHNDLTFWQFSIECVPVERTEKD